ncbi:MAG: sigma 54-interacting transcriptional regulator [Bdellovibrionota bacterium]
MNADKNMWFELPEDTKILGVGKLIAARMCLLGLLLMVASYCTFSNSLYLKKIAATLYAPIGITFAISIFSSLWAKKHSSGKLFLQAQILIDTMLITGIVWISGGAISPFLFLYLPVIMMAALLLPQTPAILSAVLAGLVYTFITWGMLRGYIPTVDGLPAADPPARGYLLQLLGLSSALILVVFLTQFLKNQLAASRKLVEKSTRDLFEANHKQKALISGMPEAVIMTAQTGKISNINHAACQLLNVEPMVALGKSLQELLTLVDENYEIANFEDSINKTEITIKPADSAQIINLVSHRQEIYNDLEEKTGSIIMFQNITKLRSAEEQLMMQERMARMLAESNKDTGPTYTKIESFVGESPVMQKVFKLIEKVATSEATVLVSGESGTGKELVAKAIHFGSHRANKPFVAVNCGAIPETLIESELFGHKKGAFTSADSDHLGLIRQATGGTIFLDEIGELPIQVQAKLLRVLQEKTVRPVGGDKDAPIDVRIIAATNRNLKAEVANGNFREDLFYRLNVIGMKLPKLSERREDIPLLVNSILCKIVDDSNKVPIITPGAMQLLLDYKYPGNVRELENILERAIVLGGEAILPKHLPDFLINLENESACAKTSGETQIFIDESIVLPMKLDDLLSGIERRCLEAALLKTKGAKKKAANMLGMNFRSFRYRLQKYDIGE